LLVGAVVSAVADKLREARALIERGWCQGDYVCGTSVCVYGAIQATLYGDPEDCSVTADEEEVVVLLKEATGSAALVQWNDCPGRTQAEVLAAFDKAIQLAEAGQ
jgi:hypothetical protein